MKKRILCIVLSLVCVMSLVTGCGKNDESNSVTLMCGTGMSKFAEAIKEKYPEINLVQQPYGGNNESKYTASQLTSGEMPDIYSAPLVWTQYGDEIEENLVDLSQYGFTADFLPALTQEGTVDGKVYLIPGNYTAYGIVYNKTLFEENGWSLPENFEELKELASKISAAGVNLAVTNLNVDTFGFQYLCNLADTCELSAESGKQWQRDFLSGEAKAEDGFGKALDYMKQWVDLGLIMTPEQSRTAYGEDFTPFEKFAEGNTAFFIGNMNRTTQNSDGSGDSFALMPYLSENGDNNKIIIAPTRVFGISKELEKEGNEQKLHNALRILEFIATKEGQAALGSDNSISALKGVNVGESSPYYKAIKEVNEGRSAPFLYAGWTEIMSKTGKSVIDFCNGKITRTETLDAFDKAVTDYLKTGVPVYAHADETIDIDTVIKMVGQAFCEESGADCALVSKNDLQGTGEIQNAAGVSAPILPVDIDDEYISVFTPGGRKSKITTVTLTGKRVKEVLKQGFDREVTDPVTQEKQTANFSYVLVTKEGFKLKNSENYTVVVCGITDALKKEGNAVTTDFIGSAAVKNYFSRLEDPLHLTEKDIEWK